MRIAAGLFLVGILLAATPTVYSHEWASFKWTCRRSGAFAGQCVADPLWRDRIGLSAAPPPTKHYRRIRAYDSMQLSGIEKAFPLEDGTMLLLPKCDDACWKLREEGSVDEVNAQLSEATREIPVTVDGEPVLFDEMRSFMDGFEAFRKDEAQSEFVHHPIAAYRPWWLLFYLGAAFVIATAYSRLRLRLRLKLIKK